MKQGHAYVPVPPEGRAARLMPHGRGIQWSGVMTQVRLGYSPRPSNRARVRRTAEWAVVGILAVAAGVFTVRIVQVVRQRQPFLATQRQCMELSFPDGQVAYEEDFAAV